MQRFIYFSVLLISIHVVGISQKYNTVGGLRFSNDLGFSVAQRLANKTTAELIFQPGTINNKTLLNVAAKQHYGLLSRRFNFFLGGGFFWSDWANEESTSSKYGFSIPLGGEITFGHLNVSFDYIPLMALKKGEGQSLFSSSTGIALRYVFWKRDSRMKTFYEKIKDKFKKKPKKK